MSYHITCLKQVIHPITNEKINLAVENVPSKDCGFDYVLWSQSHNLYTYKPFKLNIFDTISDSCVKKTAEQQTYDKKTVNSYLGKLKNLNDELQTLAKAAYYEHCNIECCYNAFFLQIMFNAGKVGSDAVVFYDLYELRDYYLKHRLNLHKSLVLLNHVITIFEEAINESSDYTVVLSKSIFTQLAEHTFKKFDLVDLIDVAQQKQRGYCVFKDDNGMYQIKVPINITIVNDKFITDITKSEVAALLDVYCSELTEITKVLPAIYGDSSLFNCRTFIIDLLNPAAVNDIHQRALAMRALNYNLFADVRLANCIYWLNFNSDKLNHAIPKLALLFNPGLQKTTVDRLLDYLNYLVWQKNFNLNELQLNFFNEVCSSMKFTSCSTLKRVDNVDVTTI